MHPSYSSSTSDGGNPSGFPTQMTDTSSFSSQMKPDNEEVYSKRPSSKSSSSSLSLGALSGFLPSTAYANPDSPKECLSPLPSTASESGSAQHETFAPHSTELSSCPVRHQGDYLEHFSREDLIRAISLYFERKTQCNLSIPHSSNPLSIFYSVSPPKISILAYIRRIITHTHCSPSAFIVALIYLERIAQRYEVLALSHVNLHRLFITAVTLAVKKLDDRTFPIAHFAKVGAVPSKEEMVRLEVAFMRLVDFNLHVTYSPYAEMINRMNALLEIVKGNTTGVLGRSSTTSSLARFKGMVNRTTTLVQTSQTERSTLTQSSTQTNCRDAKECTLSESNNDSQMPRLSSDSPLASSVSKRRKMGTFAKMEDTQRSKDHYPLDGGTFSHSNTPRQE